jgi:hypothetical protein
MDKHHSITDADEALYRERATALLDEFAQQARGILRDADIGIDLIFVVLQSGDVILTFGTAAEEWHALRTTVSSLVRRSIGLEPAQCAMSSAQWHTQAIFPLDCRRPDLKCDGRYSMICAGGPARLMDFGRHTSVWQQNRDGYVIKDLCRNHQVVSSGGRDEGLKSAPPVSGPPTMEQARHQPA